MKQTIYLRADRRGIQGMTKSMPSVYKNEIVLKMNVSVDDKAFGAPVIEQDVQVQSWAHEIDINDIAFEQNVITQAEADMIRQARLERMKEVLEGQGYTVSVGEKE